MVVGRPGYRVDNRTIKRGSQVSNLTVSFERAQTFAYLASYLSWFLFGFYPCEDLVLGLISMTISSSPKWISNEYLIAFLMFEVLPVCLL